MPDLTLMTKKKFPIWGTDERFWHFGTAKDSLGYQYICFGDRITGKMYIEQLKNSFNRMKMESEENVFDLVSIKDDKLFHVLLQFFTDNECIPMHTTKPKYNRPKSKNGQYKHGKQRS